MTVTTSSRTRAERTARTVEIVGLLVAAVGVLIEYLTGVPGFPLVPPGPIILTVAAAIVGFVRWRWSPAVGLLAALFLSSGAVASGRTAEVLAAPSVSGQWLGAVVQVVGLVTTLVAGTLALTATRRS
jgi:hypothetical protein